MLSTTMRATLTAALLTLAAHTLAAPKSDINPANGQPLTTEQKKARDALQQQDSARKSGPAVAVNPANGQPLTAEQKKQQK